MFGMGVRDSMLEQRRSERGFLYRRREKVWFVEYPVRTIALRAINRASYLKTFVYEIAVEFTGDFGQDWHGCAPHSRYYTVSGE